MIQTYPNVSSLTTISFFSNLNKLEKKKNKNKFNLSLSQTRNSVQTLNKLFWCFSGLKSTRNSVQTSSKLFWCFSGLKSIPNVWEHSNCWKFHETWCSASMVLMSYWQNPICTSRNELASSFWLKQRQERSIFTFFSSLEGDWKLLLL
jgi:hypothetical protein